MKTVSMTWPEYLAGCCRLNGNLTRLTFQEADFVLALLLSHPDHWTPREHLAECIWPNVNFQPSYALSQIRVKMTALRYRGILVESQQHWGYRIPREGRAT